RRGGDRRRRRQRHRRARARPRPRPSARRRARGERLAPGCRRRPLRAPARARVRGRSRRLRLGLPEGRPRERRRRRLGARGADAALAVLEGSETGLEPYAARLTRTLAPLVSAGWGAKVALDRFPTLMFAAARLRPLWPVVEKLVSGELRGPSEARGLGRAPVRLLAALAHRAGDPGR